MKPLHKTLLLTALLTVPFVTAHAHDSASAHQKWLEAQKIDIQPTLEITETEIPLGSTGSSTTPSSGQSMPGSPSTMPSTNMPPSNMPSTNMPSSNMPSSNMPSGSYSPARSPTPSTGVESMPTTPGMNSGMGTSNSQ